MTRSFAPTTIAEAVELLADPELAAIPVAGCTDLLVVDTATGRRHKTVVDLTRISALHGIRETKSHAEIGQNAAANRLWKTVRRRAAVPRFAVPLGAGGKHEWRVLRSR